VRYPEHPSLEVAERLADVILERTELEFVKRELELTEDMLYGARDEFTSLEENVDGELVTARADELEECCYQIAQARKTFDEADPTLAGIDWCLAWLKARSHNVRLGR